MKIVLVRWRDSAVRHGQLSPEELEDFGPVVMESVGFLVRDHKDHLVLSFERVHAAGDDGSIDDDVRDAVAIPKECILSVRRWDPERKAKVEARARRG